MSDGNRYVYAKLYVCTLENSSRSPLICIDKSGHLPTVELGKSALIDAIKKLFHQIFGFEPSIGGEWKWAALKDIDVGDDGYCLTVTYGTLLPNQTALAAGYEWVGLHSMDPRLKNIDDLLKFSERV